MLIHVVSERESVPARDSYRLALAESSWANLEGSKTIRVPDYALPRMFQDEGRKLPYLKDVLLHALDYLVFPNDDVLFFTNDDILLHPCLPWALDRYLTHTGRSFCCGARCNLKSARDWFDVLDGKGEKKPDGGRDLFAFTTRWLTDNWDKIPDFVLGATDWDWHLAFMMQVEVGMDISVLNRGWDARRFLNAVEIPLGFVWHIEHESYWKKTPERWKNLPSNLHNRKESARGRALLGFG